MTKSTRGAAFTRFQDHFMVFTEAQDPGPGKPKTYRQDKVSKHAQKTARNVALSQK